MSSLILKEMFFNHLKVLAGTAFYCCCHLLLIFTINLHSCEILTYYFFNKLLAFNNLVAISFYEILLTKLYLSIIFTVLICIPFLIIYIFLYLITGFYFYEFELYFSYYLRGLKIYLFELILCIYIVIPFLLKSSSKHLETFIIQIYSYGNITSLIVKILLLWFIVAIIVYISKWISPFKVDNKPYTKHQSAIFDKNAQALIPRRYVPLLAFIVGFLGPFGVDVFIQGIFTIGLFLYIEGHSLTKYWADNRQLG